MFVIFVSDNKILEGLTAYSHVIQIGDPTLRVKCQPVKPDMIKGNTIQKLIQHMKSMLSKYDAVGLSANQIGVPIRLFVIEVKKKMMMFFAIKFIT